MDAVAQTISMLIIDKKKMKLKDAGLPAVVLEKPWKIKLITEPFFLVNLWKKVRNVENLIKEKPGLLSGTLSTI